MIPSDFRQQLMQIIGWEKRLENLIEDFVQAVGIDTDLRQIRCDKRKVRSQLRVVRKCRFPREPLSEGRPCGWAVWAVIQDGGAGTEKRYYFPLQ